ncbi:hypothetical protein Dsin_009166 [Dipteronia sinensis]|uniref:Reverse transcriptase zinc-binding domain-containing protein n=1 Tax=Dipteronia sinensis TaxID=43782 RepID=A0AAE0EBH7_9ROSI|nr:hypothetical protein Dsin_009166 [Dipteronia sinensis]
MKKEEEDRPKGTREAGDGRRRRRTAERRRWWTGDGLWEWRKLSSILPWHIVHRIFSIHINSTRSTEDTVIWGLSKNGEFSVKSAYDIHFNGMEVDPWRWAFMWKLRGLTLDSTCDRCKEGCEDLDHVFKGCRVACVIWEDICTGITLSNHFKAEWSEWLFENLRCSKLCLGRIPGYLLFAVTLWFIWKWRSDRLFNPTFQIPTCLGTTI